jgi:hypothetical protein
MRSASCAADHVAIPYQAGNRFRGGLVVAETAVAMVLLVGAGLLVRSFAELVSEDLGFAVERRGLAMCWAW